MIKSILKNFWMIALILTTTFISCDKDEPLTSDTVENYIDEVVFDLQSRGNCGKFGCYEFIFPISIVFSDSSVVEVSDYVTLRETLKSYRQSNPDGERPSLGFPLEVMTEDGEIIAVTTPQELHKLKVACRRDFFRTHNHRGHRFRGMFCFKLNYPVSILFPDGGSIEVADRIALKEALRNWKADNPDSEERPTLQYPLTVTMEDGTEVTVDSKETLQELKESCRQ